MKKTLPFFALFFLASSAWSQRTAAGLKDSSAQVAILKATKKYDSLLLIDCANFRSDDMQIKGLAYKRKSIYVVTMLFEQTEKAPYTILYAGTRKEKLVDDRLEEAKKVNYNADVICAMNADSLAIKSKPGGYVVNMADGSIFSVVSITKKPHQLCLQQADQPFDYQKIYPTTDRTEFNRIYKDMFKCTEELSQSK